MWQASFLHEGMHAKLCVLGGADLQMGLRSLISVP
jgi:hypothetical protein